MTALLSLVPTLVDGIVKFFGNKFQSDAEKEKARQELERFLTSQLQEAWQKEQEELTKRLQLDMTSDNWLSKNIRPLVLIYLMALFTLAFWMKVPENTMDILKTLLMTAFSFYFGARTLEKIVRMFTVEKIYQNNPPKEFP
ncbi:MAG: hypothetical protein C6I01_02140 [Epsilonproteobacteria bacterium]|jgi:hypothetical protein|nr:hypothetical protein [Campylobacterota bacterium]NPA89385.1 hypothetical protein [Campylobacterota bacterium]